MSYPPTCPYCNALVSVGARTAAGQRVVCPQCEEPFVLREGVPEDTPGSQADRPEVDRGGLKVPVKRSNRLVAATVLGVMATMALVGLTFAWMTKDYRRDHDQGIPESTRRSGVHQGRPLPPLEAVLAPLQMPAVGYLPAGCDVIAGIHVGQLLRAARELTLREELTVKLGPIKLAIGKLLTARPAGIDEVDHVVGGLKAEEPLSALIVVRTRKPYDLPSVLQALGAERAGGVAKGRNYYRFNLQNVDSLRNVKLPANLWCPDDQTLVFALTDSALAAAPTEARNDGEQFSPVLRELLTDRVEPTAHVWVAGHVEDWGKTALPTLLNPADTPGVKELLATRTFGAWLYLARNNLTMRMALKGKDEAGGKRLERLLMQQADDQDGELKSYIEGNWLTWQYRLKLVSER